MAVVDEADSIGLSCSKTLVSLRQWIIGRHPAFTPGTCLTVRTVGGSSHDAMHATGRAIDVLIADSDLDMNIDAMWLILNVLVASANELGIQRVMFDGHQWNATMPVNGVPLADGPNGWPELSPAQMLANAFRDHAHIEVTKANADSITYEKIYMTLRGPLSDKINNTTGLYRTYINQDLYNMTTLTLWQSADAHAEETATASPLAITDTSGKWTRDQLLQLTEVKNLFAVGETFDATKILTYTLCGGRGGYAVRKDTGVVVAAGVAPSNGNFATGILSFVPYFTGYYGLLSDGETIQWIGNGTETADFTPVMITCLYSGPWDTLSSPISGVLVMSRTGDNLNVAQCMATVPDYALQYGGGPCC